MYNYVIRCIYYDVLCIHVHMLARLLDRYFCAIEGDFSRYIGTLHYFTLHNYDPPHLYLFLSLSLTFSSSLSSLVYRRKAMLHHYTSYMEADLIAAADQQVRHIYLYYTLPTTSLPVMYYAYRWQD